MANLISQPFRLFEEHCFEELEKELGFGWLIERVFERGTVDDIRAMRRYYGDKKIKKEVVKIQWLSKHLLYLFSGIYNIPPEKFYTYQLIHGIKLTDK
jgi:hypothetical protein